MELLFCSSPVCAVPVSPASALCWKEPTNVPVHFHNSKIMVLYFRLIIQLSAMQPAGAHDGRADGRFHVMNHGVGEIFFQPGYFPFCDDDFYLVKQSDESEYYHNRCRQQQDSHACKYAPMRIHQYHLYSL